MDRAARAEIRRGRRVRVAAFTVATVVSVTAGAGDWQITPRLSLDETYTDNVRLVEDGERGDFVTTVTPGVSVRSDSARLKTNIDYNLQHLEYGHATEFSGSNHQLQSSANLTVIENWLFFETHGRMSQQNVDNRQQVRSNNRGPNSNLRDVLSYSFTPTLRHSFGSWIDLESNWSHFTSDQSSNARDGQRQVQDALITGNSNDERSYSVNVSSGRRFARTPMTFSMLRRKAEFDSGRVSELKHYQGDLSYVLNRQLRLTASGGHDDNTFQSSRGNSSGPFWMIGGTWTPSARTSLTGNWGNRFFGDTFNVSGSHYHRRWRIDGSYSEEVQTTNDFERNLILIPLVDVNGLPIFDPVTSSEIFVPIDSPTAVDDVLISKEANVGLTYSLRRGDINLRFFQFDRQYQSGNFNELTRGVSATWSWQLSRKLGCSLSGSWRENERGTGSSGTYYSLTPSLDYELGPHTTARLRYEYTQDDGSGSGGNDRPYTENALTAAFVFHL